jgi:hypothetical protein
MNHQDVEKLLPWFVNQTLDEDQVELVEEHLKNCPVCQAEVNDLRDLNQMIGEANDEDVAEGQQQLTIDAAVRRARGEMSPKTFRARRHRWFFPTLAMAALLLLAFQNLVGLNRQVQQGLAEYHPVILKGAVRGAEETIKTQPGQPVFLNIPNPDSAADFEKYRCELLLEGEQRPLFLLNLEATGTFYLQLPPQLEPGRYTLNIFGEPGQNQEPIGSYRFLLDDAKGESDE